MSAPKEPAPLWAIVCPDGKVSSDDEKLLVYEFQDEADEALDYMCHYGGDGCPSHKVVKYVPAP